MKDSPNLTEHQFESLLRWLDPDREAAASEYESIRTALIKIFSWNQCSDAEDLADETITRVAHKAPNLATRFSGDPRLYFYGVARNLIAEYRRTQARRAPLDQAIVRSVASPDPDAVFQNEARHEALTQCLNALPKEARELLLEYYLPTDSLADRRLRMAQRLGVSVATLRQRMTRLRVGLQKRILEYLNDV